MALGGTFDAFLFAAAAAAKQVINLCDLVLYRKPEQVNNICGL